LIVVVFLFVNKGGNYQESNEKRRQASKIGMSTSKVDCCFLFCFKTNASINLRAKTKNEAASKMKASKVDCFFLFVNKGGNHQKGKTINLRR